MASSRLRPVLPAGQAIRLATQCQPRSQLLPFLLPFTTIRFASAGPKSQKAKETPVKKKKQRTHYSRDDLKFAKQFTLCEAMRYIRAFEVGQKPNVSKYEVHVSLKSAKNGPVVRNRLQLPHPVDTSKRICVICPPDSAVAAAAIKAGASLVGEETIFEAVREGRIEFERCLCHVDSQQKLAKANLGKILGPKGLLPSAKTATVIKDVAASIRSLIGGSEYREKLGVVRLAIGQLGFTPEQMQQNIKAFMGGLKKDLVVLNEKINKDIHEVVLSSTHSPGFTLSGEFRKESDPPTSELSVS